MTAEPVRSYDDDEVEYPRYSTTRRARTAAPDRPRRATEPARKKPSIPAPRGSQRTSRPAAPPVPVAAPRTPFVLLVLGLVAAGIVGLLLLNTAINTNAFTLSKLHDKQATLDAQEQQYKRDLADLESPGNLQAAATRMGLVPAGSTAFIRLPDGKVIGVPQPAGQ